MTRYAGIKTNKIFIISDHPIVNSDLSYIEIPNHLENISNQDLLISGTISPDQQIIYPTDKSANQLKVALVGNYRMQCGISSYAENLWGELAKRVGQVKLFIEKNDQPSTGDVYQLGDQQLSQDQVSICWKRGEPLNQLIQELREYHPDIILFSHEWGLWSNASQWLSMMTQLSKFRIIATMHSIYRHRDKTIVEAAIPEMIVHLEAAKNVLRQEKGLTNKIHVIPHGCYPHSSERLWNFYKSDHTLIQTGFLFRYKNFQDSIKAVALLKDKYPKIFFTGVCSESPHAKNEHQVYYNELLELIDQLKVQDHICLVRGFQSDQVIDSYYRTNRIALFPYTSSPEHEVFGASGASRLAMSKYLPVISSNHHLFSDLPTIKTSSPQEMAERIDQLFSDKQAYQQQLDQQEQYMQENSWEKVAEKYVQVFENKMI